MDLGVASSVACQHNYSWSQTLRFCRAEKLNTAQLYINPDRFSDKDIPDPGQINNLILHLPDLNSIKINQILSIIDLIRREWSSLKVIFHQFVPDNQHNVNLLRQLSRRNLALGMENDGGMALSDFSDNISALNQAGLAVFPVIDFHRFYVDFYPRFSVTEIERTIISLNDRFSAAGTEILWHIIDSRSFKSSRSDWCPLFSGIIPYTDFIDKIKVKSWHISAIILEYEAEEITRLSLRELRRII